MRFLEIIRVALSSLRATKSRAVLTALGIVIGVGAVITMVALGSGAQRAVESQLEALGTDRLSIMPGQSFSRGVATGEGAPLTTDDADSLRTGAPALRAVAPVLGGRAQVKYGSANINVNVTASSASIAAIERYDVEFGRFFSDGEDHTRRLVAVVGHDVPSELNVDDAASLVGQEIQVRGITFTVLGVLALDNRGGRDDPDETVFIPLGTGQYRIFGTNRIQSITVRLASGDSMTPGVLDIEHVLRREHRLRPNHADDFRIQDNAQFLAARAQASQTMTWLLAGIAAVSLLVGGIGIMNIMLVSVTERTREIGVRKALGATRRNILGQFLFEAITLCLIGGVIGVAAGYAAATALARWNGWAMAVSADSIAVAVGFSVTIGLFFGVWPARRASRLDPIVALRYE